MPRHVARLAWEALVALRHRVSRTLANLHIDHVRELIAWCMMPFHTSHVLSQTISFKKQISKRKITWLLWVEELVNRRFLYHAQDLVVPVMDDIHIVANSECVPMTVF